MQFTYGIATSTEVAYYTYIYAKVPKMYYQKVTSFTRVAILLGRFVSGASSQLLVSGSRIGLPSLDYRQLNYISLISVSFATLVSFLLPKVNRTLYFHRRDPSKEQIVQPLDNEEYDEVCENTSQILEDSNGTQVRWIILGYFQG
jgi:thiamine transporter 2/3